METTHKRALLILFGIAAFLASTFFGLFAFDSAVGDAGFGMAILVGFAMFCQLMTISIYVSLIIDLHLDGGWL